MSGRGCPAGGRVSGRTAAGSASTRWPIGSGASLDGALVSPDSIPRRGRATPFACADSPASRDSAYRRRRACSPRRARRVSRRRGECSRRTRSRPRGRSPVAGSSSRTCRAERSPPRQSQTLRRSRQCAQTTASTLSGGLDRVVGDLAIAHVLRAEQQPAARALVALPLRDSPRSRTRSRGSMRRRARATARARACPAASRGSACRRRRPCSSRRARRARRRRGGRSRRSRWRPRGCSHDVGNPIRICRTVRSPRRRRFPALRPRATRPDAEGRTGGHSGTGRRASARRRRQLGELPALWICNVICV